MGNYFDKKTCQICDADGTIDYDNPLLLIYHHKGKQNKRYYCWMCIRSKMNYENLRRKNKINNIYD